MKRHSFFVKVSCLALWLFLSAAHARGAMPNLPEPAQKLAAELLEVYALPEGEQTKALRRILAENTELITELAQAPIPPAEVLNERLWPRLGTVNPSMRAAVNAIVDTLKSDTFRAQFSSKLAQVTPEVVHRIPAKYLDNLLSLGRAQIASIKVSDHPGFRRILDPQSGLVIDDPTMRQMVEKLMPRFFDNLGVKIKARMAAAVLRLPADASTAQQASAVLQNAGPLTQKIFQLVGEKTNSEELSQIMSLLKQNIKPIPKPVIMQVLAKRFGPDRLKEMFKTISDSKNSGTVGQVHFADVKKTGEEVVIKVVRPGAVEDFASEAEAMRAAAKGEGLENIADKVINNIGREFDLRNEAVNIKESEVYIDSKQGLGIAGLVDGFEPQEDVIVIKKAPGKSIAKFTEADDLVKRGIALEKILERWMKVAAFRNGFFNGDLHSGNIFFDPTVANEVGFQATILDPGNSAFISRSEQRGFVKLIAGITLQSSEQTLEGLAQVGKVPDANREALLAELKKILVREPEVPLHRWMKDVMGEIAKLSLKYEVDVPESFLAFTRGKEFLEMQIDEVNRLLDLKDPERKLRRFDPTRAELRALAEETKEKAVARILGRAEPDTMLSREVLTDAMKAWNTSPYFAALKKNCAMLYKSLHQLPY